MLKLTLKNFRKFTTAEFTFDKQLSLISGKSGQGKTTIFMAIMFAFTGEGKKLPTYGKNSCSVTLVIENITIIRTKRPNRLRVTVGGNMYEDKEAQAIIDDLFPQYHMGYMSQRSDNGKSFILMTPTDKIRYIEKMAFGNENVDQLINNCKELVKNRKSEMMLTTRQRETTEKMLNDFKIEKTSSCNQEDLLDEVEYDHKISENEDKLDSLKNKLIKTENLIKMKEGLMVQLTKIPEVDEDIDYLEDELQRINTHKQGWERYQREKTKLKNLNQPSGISKDEMKDIINDMKTMICLETEVADLEKCRLKIDKLSQMIEKSMVYIPCPSCSTELAIWCNKLILSPRGECSSAKANINPTALTAVEAKQLEEKRMKLKLRVEELENKVVMLEEMKLKYPNVKNAQKQLDSIFKTKSDDEAYLKQKTLCSSLKVESPSYDETTEASLRKKKKALYERKEKEDTLSSIAIKHNPDELIGRISSLVESIVQMNTQKKFAKSLQYWNMVENLMKTEAVLNISYPRAIKLQEIIKTAERMAVTEVIEEINLHAQMYLDSFIDDLNVMLVFDGVKLNVEVMQNSHEGDLQNLSGGELARVILAFTIALAEINNVRLLLLDECVSSLDQESTGQVIDTIKANFTGNVICIAHQTTTGVFDHVLEL